MGNSVFNIRHRCFFFAKAIIALVSETRYDRKFYSIFDQLLRSGTSVGANLVEGYAGSSGADFVRYLNIALKSANETKYWLCLIRDTMQLSKDTLDGLIKEADEISRILAAIIINQKRNKNSGQ